MPEVNSFIQDLLAHLGVEGDVEVTETDEYITVQINVSDQDSGILIGHHGETIRALQLIANTVFRKAAEDKRVTVNVNDYREKREEQLQQMAHRYAERAVQSGVKQVLPFLTAAERLVIHTTLKDHPEVSTQSEGDGMARRLVVRLK